MTYYNDRRVEAGFEEAIELTREALAEEGFGVLAEIDVTEKMEEKLELEEFRDYRILGACNPPLANEGLENEINLGVLLPCNVVVYVDDDGETVVSAVDPSAMLSVVGNPEMDPIAEEVGESLDRVLNSLPATA
jgi:uncharacterized protein (DUF302 family)